MFVTAEELLAGREMTFEVEIPAQVLSPSLENGNGNGNGARKIQLRLLTVKDVQLIAKGEKEDEVLTSELMIQ